MKWSVVDTVRYSILFSCLFICIGQISFWFNYLILPFALFGFCPRRVNDVSTRNLFKIYILLAILVLATGLIGIGFYYPIKRFLEIVSCIIYSYTIYLNIQSSGNCIPLFKGLFIASLVLSVYLFCFYADVSTFSLRFENVEFGPGKNDSAMHLFAGLFSAIVLRNVERKCNMIYFVGGTFIFLLVVMSGSMKAVIAALPFEFLLVYFAFRNKKSTKIFIAAMLLYLYSIRDVIIELFEIGFLRVIYSRIVTLIGLGQYAPIEDMKVTDVREDLISAVFNIFLDDPILGVGLENTRLIIGTYSHNTYVELAAGAGVFAPFIFAGLVGLCMYYLWCSPKNSCRIYFLLYVVMISVVFANSLKVYSAQEAIVFLILSPYIIRLYSKYKVNEN